jgi:acetylornithine deacetylase/succinyl-diaminopimelate desuccinylase-like protein
MVPQVLEALADLARSQASDPILGRASLVATGIEARPESRNVIPDEVVVVVDWRVLPGLSNEDLLAQVRSSVAARLPRIPEGMALEIRMAREEQEAYTGRRELRDLYTPGFLMSSDHPVIRAGADAVGRREGEGPAHVRPWTFATDGGWSSGVFGIPTLGFAPGEERYAHTNRERLDLDEARWAFSRYPALVLAVQQALGS